MTEPTSCGRWRGSTQGLGSGRRWMVTKPSLADGEDVNLGEKHGDGALRGGRRCLGRPPLRDGRVGWRQQAAHWRGCSQTFPVHFNLTLMDRCTTQHQPMEEPAQDEHAKVGNISLLQLCSSCSKNIALTGRTSPCWCWTGC